MAIIQRLDVSFKGEGLNAPKLTKVDRIESAGSLFLLDMSKEASWDLSNKNLTNLFETQAQSITGSATTAAFSKNLADSTIARTERTAKGGLYFISKHATISGTYPNNFMQVAITGGVKDWIRTHFQGDAQEHQFFFSTWFKLPEYVEGDLEYVSQYSTISNHTTERVFYMQVGAITQENNRYSRQSVHGTGSPTYPTASAIFNAFNGGNAGLNMAGSTNKRLASVIFYRMYVEDLTISGRTFAQVDALDQQLFTEAFSSGGKFYGDTYTSPTVLG